MVRVLQDRYGLSTRERAALPSVSEPPPAEPAGAEAEAEQVGFAWD